MVVVENTANVHNVIVCTLCSCYPWPVLGLPPSWYKSPAYRSRIVREPRAVLAEMGVDPSADVDEFRQLLIEDIRQWEEQNRSEDAWSYYARWQAAFEKLLATKGLCGSTELQERVRALAARPAGHDH